MSIFWRKIEKSLDGCPIRNAENRQIEQFREKERTAPPGKVKLLQSVDFYGILICRKDAVLQVQRSCFPPRCHCSCHRQEEVQFFVILLTVRMFLHENLREDSTMEILNTVIALLGLLATVILGTAKITWTIAQVFFRDMHHARHYIKK